MLKPCQSIFSISCVFHTNKCQKKIALLAFASASSVKAVQKDISARVDSWLKNSNAKSDVIQYGQIQLRKQLMNKSTVKQRLI